MNLSWSSFKSLVQAKSLNIQYEENNAYYFLSAFDDGHRVSCDIYKNPSDTTELADFEGNFKPSANGFVEDRDASNRKIVRPAAATEGWSYIFHTVEIETSKIGSLYSKTWQNNDVPNLTVNFYDASDVELTVQGDIDTSCVKTVLTWKPTFDYDLVSGQLYQHAIPSTNLRLWVIAGPLEIPSAVVEFVRCVNIKYIGTEEHLITDGRASKRLNKVTAGVPYDTNQLQFILRHDAGIKHQIMLGLEYFRA